MLRVPYSLIDHGIYLMVIIISVHRHKWVSVTRAWRVLSLRMGNGLQVWKAAANTLNKQSRKAAANTLNKQSRTADSGWSSNRS